MISLETVHGWLNVITPTHLSTTSRRMISTLEIDSLSERNLDHLIEEVIQFSQKSTDRLEYAEVLAQAAVVRAERGDLKIAQDYLSTALEFFEGNHYKHAVVLWMLGWVEWRLGENRAAYAHWDEVRDLLSSIVRFLAVTHRYESFEQIPWFLDRIKDINQELVRQPEEAYSWIHLFEPTNLDDAALAFRSILDSKIAENKNASAFKAMEALHDLVQFAPDYQATTDGLVEVGLAAYQLGIVFEAERVLLRAVALSEPETHRQAAVLWMLGAVQLSAPHRILEAVRNWERSLDIFESIPPRLPHRNRKAYLDWHNEILPALQQALEAVIASTG